MAQWLGQFTGRTHASKVLAIEESLQKAVAKLQVTPAELVTPQINAVVRLAERLLRARRKQMKVAHSIEREARTVPLDTERMKQLVTSQERLENGGIAAILTEFKVSHLLGQTTSPPPTTSS
jgi:hypothetical protein